MGGDILADMFVVLVDESPRPCSGHGVPVARFCKIVLRIDQRAVKNALDPDNLFGASNHGVRGTVVFEKEPGA
ncbi:hypothetical protein [Pendulispora albinea]|uniref:Uncharacterized protein n=1 Tax=Pendulispora albinea TaxID=2741071 RepID=A0ABZ2MBD2_9BACT